METSHFDEEVFCGVISGTIITVEDTSTGKVIRQIPDPAALKVAYNIEQLKGVLLDEDI